MRGARRAALSPLCLRSGHHLSSSCGATSMATAARGNKPRARAHAVEAVRRLPRLRRHSSARNGKRQFLCLDFDPSCMESCFLLLQYWKIVIEFEICLMSQIFCMIYTLNKYTYMAPTYLLLPLGKWGLKWGDFHWAMGYV